MKQITTIVNIVKIVAQYGAFLIVLVEGLNFISEGWERVIEERKLKDGSK
jgi:hypothetical protein